MGVRAGLHEITPQAFDEMMAGGNPDVSGGKYYALDKAWSEIHDMLQPAGYPLNQAIVGDALHPDSNHSYEDFCVGKHDYYAGFVSVEMVKKIARALEGIQVPDIPEISRRGENDSHVYIDYVGSMFRVLQAAYREASSRGNALMVVIA
jgi:Domain of unknown function (DUF1877)